MEIIHCSKAFYWILKKFSDWIDSKIIKTKKITLSRKNIYILPTKYGFIYGLVVCAVFIIGINYSNNMLLTFTFFLVSILIVAIFHTYRNLVGIKISVARETTCFAGEKAPFSVTIENTNHYNHQSIHMVWDGGENNYFSELSNVALSKIFFLKANKRGLMQPGKIKLFTVFPLGLFYAWSWIQLDTTAIVYPKPIKFDLSLFKHEDETKLDKNMQNSVTPTGDFFGIKPYTVGDSIRAIDWKAYARLQQIYSKNYCNSNNQDLWLRWAEIPGTNTELKLSFLCYQMLNLFRSNKKFGLSMPGFLCYPNSGANHLETCLTALAKF